MKTKTTNGVTVVIATEQDRRTLDRAIDVLIEYSVRSDETAMAEDAHSAVAVLREIIGVLSFPEIPPKPAPAKPAK